MALGEGLIEEDASEECESCQYPTTKLKSFRKQGLTDARAMYCWLCSASFISSQHAYPTLHHEDANVLRAIGFATNAILDALGKLRDPNEES